MRSPTGSGLLFTLILLVTAGAPLGPAGAQEVQEIDGIAAIVGEEIILKSEVYLQFQLELGGQGLDESTLSEEQRDQMYATILDRLIDRSVIVEQARIDSVVVSRSEVETAIDEWINTIKTNLGSEANFQQQLLAEGITEQELRRRRQSIAEMELLQNIMFTQKLDYRPGQVSRRRGEEFLLEAADELMIIRHIFLKMPEGLDPAILARATVDDLRRRIVDEGEDFAAIAREHSADSGSRPLGGDLGSAPRGNFVPSIDDVVWSLPINEVSEPIRSQFGWHLVQVISRDSTNAHARHILIQESLEGAAIQALADTIGLIESALEAGEDFEAVAARFSDAESAQNRQAYYALMPKGFSPNTGIPAEWYQALEAIETGAWTEPLEVSDGVNILQLLAVDEESVTLVLQHDFSTVQFYIHSIERQEAAGEWLSDLRSRTYIEIKPGP